MADEITITIDGVDVTTTPDKMVIQAASDAGIYIPYLCYYPGMKPFGACRMCVVTAEAPDREGNYRPLPGSPRVLHDAGYARDARNDQLGRHRGAAARHHGPAHIGASTRLPDLPPHRTLRTFGQLSATCICER